MKQALLHLLLPLPFAVLLALAVSLGSTIDDTAAPIRLLNACELPCWQRLEPGVTSLPRVDIVMSGLGYTLTADSSRGNGVLTYEHLQQREQCLVEIHYANDIVRMIILKNCGGARLGDFLALLGEPESVFSTGRSLAFRSFSIILGLEADLCGEWLSPYTPVISVRLVGVNDGLADTIRTWRGFMPYWRYLQLEPEMRAADC